MILPFSQALLQQCSGENSSVSCSSPMCDLPDNSILTRLPAGEHDINVFNTVFKTTVELLCFEQVSNLSPNLHVGHR